MKNSFEKQVRRDERAMERKKGRFLRKALLIFLAFCVWSAAVVFCCDRFSSAFSTEKRPVEAPVEDEKIVFHDVIENQDIEQNERWLERDRQIYFGTQYTYQAIDEETVSSLGDYAEFFYAFFTSIIHGDAETYATFFEDSYPKSKLPKSFTKQMLFETYALEYGDNVEVLSDGQEIKVKDFVVEYKILENNGTFRNDLASSVAKPQYYRLITDEKGEIRIHSILEIRQATLEQESGSADTNVNTTRAVVFGILCVALVGVPVVSAVFLLIRFRKKVRS